MNVKTIQIAVLIILVVAIIAVFYFNRDPKAFIRPEQITNVYDENVFTFLNMNNKKEVVVKVIGTEQEYSSIKLKEILLNSQGLQLVTPKDKPFDSKKRVRAYVYIDGEPLN